MNITAKITATILGASVFIATPAFAALEDDISKLQHEWEQVKYQTVAADHEKGYERLLKEADKVVSQYADKAEPLIWHGIIEGSYAGAKGGIGALRFAKNARRDFEQALKINPDALAGSAYTSLGSLYYQVPGWPIGFGDHKKASEFLKKGLSANPDGIDPNYFYGDFLYRTDDLVNAEQVLRKALMAAPRPGRKVADEGRRKEINQLLEKIAAERK